MDPFGQATLGLSGVLSVGVAAVVVQETECCLGHVSHIVSFFQDIRKNVQAENSL